MSAVTVERTPEDGRLLVRPPSLTRRRPVLSFLGVLALVCLVLAGVGRSGVAAPQVRMRITGGFDVGSTQCATTYSLVNDGLRPVEVETVAWGPGVGLVAPGTELHTAEAAMSRTADDISPFAPFTLPGGAHREIVVPYPCTSMNPAGDPAVHVRSADLGLRRTIRPT